MGQHIAMRGQDWETSVGPARISGEIAARGREPPASNGLSSVHLSSFGLRREAPRSLDDRPADYERLFDFETLFYDVFRSSDSRQVICLGPPLLNCEPALSTAMFRGPAGQGAVQWEYRPPRSQHQPTCRFRLTGPGLAEADRIVLEMAGRELDIPIRPSGHSRFAGRRVITTLSKDNPLAWIRDWAAFNVRVHGADAVLFYDNGSVNYDMAELGRVLEGVPGVAASLIIPWNFPYGSGTGPRNIQDSFYCQPGALEHARRRYCAAARAVLNTDIDELVPKCRSGESDFVRHSDCTYSERWRAALRRVCPFRWLLRMKWIVVPGRCPDDVDWGVHDLHARQPESRRTEASWKCRPRDVFYWHFRQINSSRWYLEWRWNFVR
jgi:hypothetical protein